jgi:hypothetical protein
LIRMGVFINSMIFCGARGRVAKRTNATEICRKQDKRAGLRRTVPRIASVGSGGRRHRGLVRPAA